jgi:hypothetical protein
MAKKHEETAWIPLCVPEHGSPFFFDRSIRDRKRDARDHFVRHCNVEWADLRKEGWQIVRVKLTTELH